MKKILLLAIFATLMACSGTKKPSFSVQDVELKEQKTIAEIPNDMIKNRRYVLFSSQDPQYIFDNVDDMVIKGENIYILYRKNRHFKLLKFDMNGRGVYCLDRQGEGPDEYNQISAFDVDENGDMHIVDGRQDELFVYDKDGALKKRVNLPYEVGVVHCLKNGDYLFGLSSWNTGEAKGARLVLSGSDLTVKKRVLEYDGFNDDRAIIGDDFFTVYGNVVAFNTVISNTQYILDIDGYLTSELIYDFGAGNIPDEDKKEVEDRIWKNDEYRCPIMHTIASEDYIFGNVWRSKGMYSYLIDKKNGVIYSGESGESSVMSCIANGAENGEIVSVLSPQMYEKLKDGTLPDDVAEHLSDDNFAVCLTILK
ncbi:MAG: 6-bladed beta-propeller [Flavobacteriales bacterium]|nr:6-bladed beta-propeller [Flavobacteriales bacterium]